MQVNTSGRATSARSACNMALTQTTGTQQHTTETIERSRNSPNMPMFGNTLNRVVGVRDRYFKPVPVPSYTLQPRTLTDPSISAGPPSQCMPEPVLFHVRPECQPKQTMCEAAKRSLSSEYKAHSDEAPPGSLGSQADNRAVLVWRTCCGHRQPTPAYRPPASRHE